VFLSFHIVSFILTVVGPDFFAEPVLEVVFPFAFILSAILMYVNSMTIGFVVQPFTFEDVSIYVPELSVAACFVESPVSFVLGAILPDLLTITMFHVSEPLTCISCSIFEIYLSAVFKLRLINIV